VRAFVRLPAAALALLLCGTAGRADPINWSVDFKPDPGQLTAGDSSVSFAGHSVSGKTELNKPKSVTALYVDYFSTAAANNPDTFDHKFKVTATIKAGGQTANLTFDLGVKGKMSANNSDLKIHKLPSDPKFVTLDGHLFRVRIYHYIAVPLLGGLAVRRWRDRQRRVDAGAT
jgi:hypothetical protein